jgi:hypothetical protein
MSFANEKQRILIVLGSHTKKRIKGRGGGFNFERSPSLSEILQLYFFAIEIVFFLKYKAQYF